MKNPEIEELQKHLGKLVGESLKVNIPVETLYRIGEKIRIREYQHFDRREIIVELNRLQSILNNLHTKIRFINNLLKQYN